MKKTLFKTGRIILFSLLAFIGFIVLYYFAMKGISKISVNSEFSPVPQDSITVYIKTNGVHTDLVLPMRNKIHNWYSFVIPGATQSKDTTYSYVAFGWGDKGFYLETPTWADLKASTALKAMFFLSSTAMHVTFYHELHPDENCIALQISKVQYEKMVSYVQHSFTMRENHNLLIPGASYDKNDIFFDANGTYNLFFTCNSWANQGLKKSGIKACLWTLFDRPIFDQFAVGSNP